MSFIHRDHGNLCSCCKLPKLPCFQSLRCHVDNLICPLCRIIQCLGNLRFRKGGIDICSPDSCRIQCFYLILHQRDQRGDHNRNPRQHQCRQLVTDGLARTGGHNRQSIPPTQDRIRNSLLPFPEGRIAKVFF